MFNDSAILLTDKDHAKQLNVLIRKLHQLYTPSRWTDPETFEREFEKEYLHTYGLQADLNRSFKFTVRVGRKAKPALRRGTTGKRKHHTASK